MTVYELIRLLAIEAGYGVRDDGETIAVYVGQSPGHIEVAHPAGYGLAVVEFVYFDSRSRKVILSGASQPNSEKERRIYDAINREES